MANVIIRDPKHTIDLALDNYVSESEEIDFYELVGDALVEENGDISCGAKFDNDPNVYTVVLHDGNIYIN